MSAPLLGVLPMPTPDTELKYACRENEARSRLDGCWYRAAAEKHSLCQEHTKKEMQGVLQRPRTKHLEGDLHINSLKTAAGTRDGDGAKPQRPVLPRGVQQGKNQRVVRRSRRWRRYAQRAPLETK